MNLTDFLLARIAEDEESARACDPQSWWVDGDPGDTVYRVVHASWEERAETPANVAHIARHDPGRVLRECEAKRRIVELHKSWPVLVERPPTFDRVDASDLTSVTFRASQQIAWTTEQEYRNRFGDEPPTAPMMRALAAVYADHPDYREEWRP